MGSNEMKIEEVDEPRRGDVLGEILWPFDLADPMREAIIRNWRAELLELGRNRAFFVGLLHERPASVVQLVLINADNDPSLADGLTVAHIHGLWVRKDLQRRGLASEMMRHAETAAALRGFRMLTVGVENHNLGARDLYKGLGFEEFGFKPGRCPDETLLLLRKEIDPLKRSCLVAGKHRE